MKRHHRILAVVLAVLLLLPMLASCGGSGGGYSGEGMYYNDTRTSNKAAMAEDGVYDYDEAAWEMPTESYSSSYGSSGGGYRADQSYVDAKPLASSSASGQTAENRPRKLVRTADMSMETTTFDDTVTALADLTKRLNGYFEDNRTGERGTGRRWASYTIRVPEQHFQDFLSQAGELCHTTSLNWSQIDISERYYDTDGRLKTQQIKLERLQDLLEKAKDMADIITILSAISETEQTIDELTGELRRYDNQVSYSTISLQLDEVTRLSNVPEEQEGYFSELGSTFIDGIRDFAEWVGDIVLSLAYSWLWLLLFAAIIVGLVRFFRRREKKRNQSTDQQPGEKHSVKDESVKKQSARKKWHIIPNCLHNPWKKSEQSPNNAPNNPPTGTDVIQNNPTPSTDNPQTETDNPQTETDNPQSDTN